MLKLRSKIILILLLCICLISVFYIAQIVGAAETQQEPSRSASWYNMNYGTSPLGGTYKIGQFGPDFGIGEQGYQVQYTTPYGGFMNYSVTGIGMGLGGLLAGYGGMYSPLALQSYGPFAYGNNPQVMPTLGWSTQGAMSGSALGGQMNYYQASPSMLGLLFGMLGTTGWGYPNMGLGFGGLGGWGLGGYGFGGFGMPFFGGGWW